MRELYKGHLFGLTRLDGPGEEIIQFVQRPPFHGPKPGTTNQEVLRVLIQRVKVLDAETPWDGNQQVLHHLRMALVLHEARAMVRAVEKGDRAPEFIVVGLDGHFKLEFN